MRHFQARAARSAAGAAPRGDRGRRHGQDHRSGRAVRGLRGRRGRPRRRSGPGRCDRLERCDRLGSKRGRRRDRGCRRWRDDIRHGVHRTLWVLMVLSRRTSRAKDTKRIRYQAGPLRRHDGVGRELAGRRQRGGTPRRALSEHGNPEPLLATGLLLAPGPLLGPGAVLPPGPFLGPDSLRRTRTDALPDGLPLRGGLGRLRPEDRRRLEHWSGAQHPDFPSWLCRGQCRAGGGHGALGGHPPLRWAATVPDAGGQDHLVLLAERREADPGPGLCQVAGLGLHQLRQPLILDDGPGGQPGDYAWRQYVQPDQGVVERQSYSDQQKDIGDRDPSEYGDPVDRQRHGQPEVV
jgi:hypothetical protein